MTAKTNQMAVQPLNVFSNIQSFEDAQRMAKVFVSSPLVPQQFRGDLGSVLIAFNMANRTGADPLQVMQNIYIVHGKPAFSASYLIACFNQCGKYSAIRYQFSGEQGTDTWGCKAVTTELSTGEVLEGTLVTLGMAKAEGWYNKAGSKWKTMPELMMRYRSATFLIRAIAPEISHGFQTREEVIDITDQVTIVDDAPATPTTLDEVAMLAVAEQAQPTQPEPVAEPKRKRAKAEPKAEQPATEREQPATASPEPVAQPTAEAQPEKGLDFTSRYFNEHHKAENNGQED